MQYRYCFALDLKDDKSLITEYEKYHQKVWPEILKTIGNAGIEHMEIYRVSNRLFMIIESENEVDFVVKAKSDASNEKVQEWETLMWKYQQAIPAAKQGEKWMMMKKVFEFKLEDNV